MLNFFEFSSFTVLMISALITSALSGVIGMGGGMFLITVMAQYYPITTLIPLHGITQLVRNFTRAAIGYRAIEKKPVLHFGCGALLGAFLGSLFIFKVSTSLYKMGLGLFVLVITFIPLPRPKNFKPAWKWFAVGGVSSFLGFFVGATGPLIAPFYLNENFNKEKLVTTKAASQTFFHFFKVLMYFALGFNLWPHLSVLFGMLVMVVMGNILGRLILNKISEFWFLKIFKMAILFLSLKLIFEGLH